jgi:glycosyltransferase involved in cell wall biosynthesis
MARTLILDMTPICINKTAIYHIALDTLKALTCFDVKVQFRGQIGGMPRSVYDEREIAEAFFLDVQYWAAGSTHDDEINLAAHVSAGMTPRLYFDPIYTLYGQLNERDVVFVLDLSPLTNPEWHNPSIARVYERAFRKLLGSKARIVSISNHCTTSLRANFSIPATDIVTVPLYLRSLIGQNQQKPKKPLPYGRFFLFVGSMELRKNLIGLVRAFAMSALSSKGWALVLAGGKGQGWEAITEAAEQAENVELLGYVSDAELSWLYHHATAFAYPSYLEGFGLPLVEAMVHGLPCLASVTGASAEVCKDLGILVDPYNMQSIVQGLIHCAQLSDALAADSKAKIVSRAREFTFEKYLAKLLEALPFPENSSATT